MMRSAAIAVLILAASQFLPAAPLETPKKPVTDTYHGVTVTDPYRRLEDWNDKAVQKWSEAQSTHARGVLDKFPGVEPLRERLTKIMAAKTTSHGSFAVRGDRAFALCKEPPKQQPFLVVLPAADKPVDAFVLFDLALIDKIGRVTSSVRARR